MQFHHFSSHVLRRSTDGEAVVRTTTSSYELCIMQILTDLISSGLARFIWRMCGPIENGIGTSRHPSGPRWRFWTIPPPRHDRGAKSFRGKLLISPLTDRHSTALPQATLHAHGPLKHGM